MHKRSVCVSVVGCVVFMALAVVQGAAGPGPTVSESVMNPSVVAATFAQLQSVDPDVKLLDQILKDQGFVPLMETGDFWGQSTTTTDASLGLSVTTEVQVHNYGRPAVGRSALPAWQITVKADVVAIVRIVDTSGDWGSVYTCYLIAAGGNFPQAQEYTIVDPLSEQAIQVTRANSWWSCTMARIIQKCPGSNCISSFNTCGGTWTQYLGCVASACSCYIAAGSCCSCNCKKWCKWACGCCHQ